MPLSKIQSEVLRLLAAHRDPESYVAGAKPLNRAAARFSGDIDVFHDREERVAEAALNDAAVLEGGEYHVAWLRQLPTIYASAVTKGDNARGWNGWWTATSAFSRQCGMKCLATFCTVDLAMNKAMAAAGRRELRDLVDLLTVREAILPLGAVVWAAVEKSPGFTPEGLIADIRRNSNYPRTEWLKLISSEPLDPKEIMGRLRGAAEDGQVVQPDPGRLDEYRTHAGQRRGQWPSSADIAAAMLERYKKPPTA